MSLQETAQSKTQLARYAPGTLVGGRYRIQEFVARGGFGLVLRAEDTAEPGLDVALKILYANFASDQKLLARFKREMELAQALDHPGIVKALDLGVTGDGTFYLATEFVEGETLGAKLKRCKPRGIPFAELALYLKDAALAFHHAHEKGIIHRDVKPENIIITPGGQVKVTDFGIGRPVITAEKLTATAELIGSVAYMSPEQCRGEQLDCRSDIYSFGIMAFELASGDVPFDHPDIAVVLARHEHDELPEYPDSAEVPGWFEKITSKACAKMRADRFQDMQSFANAIDAGGHGGGLKDLVNAIKAPFRYFKR